MILFLSFCFLLFFFLSLVPAIEEEAEVSFLSKKVIWLERKKKKPQQLRKVLRWNFKHLLVEF